VSVFREAGHLPNLRADGMPADPAGLPRQRRGTTPQMHGRYPDYDVLEQADHWDEATRRVVLARVHDVPPIRFFTPEEASTLQEFCDTVLAQDDEPRIPTLNFIDEKLHEGRGEGYRYHDMPPDGEAWRIVAAGLDEAAVQAGASSFVGAPVHQRLEICHAFSQGELRGGAWDRVNVERAWGLVMRDALSAYYAHPWAWNEIGFGGPAYPRGYSRLGVGMSEAWEGQEAFELDPVEDVQQRGIDL